MEYQDVEEKGDIRNVPKYILTEIINTYKSHPALWKMRDKNVYSNRALKQKGYQALVKVWKKFDEDADIRMVKNKVQSLRGSFRKELKKVQNSQKSGNGAEGSYKSRLWYFTLMSFLTDDEVPTASLDHLDAQECKQDSETLEYNIENDDETDNEEMSENSSPDILFVPAKKKKAVTAFPDPLGNNETENDAFGKFISKKLDRISSAEQRMYAESLIAKVANYGILNKLTESTDIVVCTRLRTFDT